MARSLRRPGNLPAEVTSFVGRRRELAELRQSLSEARIVSVVGPGGVGKTRLAVRIGTDLARGFRDGAWLVELAEIQDATLVPNAVLAALDLRDQSASEPLETLLANLREKELLLVVDNCEHVLDASAGLIAQVCRSAPGVRVLATSREPLSIVGEHVVALPPLDLPAPSRTSTLEQLAQNEAVMLFTERATAASGGYELTAANRSVTVDLCRRLDGLPLAIELAAVRTRVLSVEQVLERLDDRFALLTGGSRAALPRHQTLRTAIDWSYDLLREDERTLLRRLYVFAGSFSLDDVEAVSFSPALDALSSLVDKSLVMRHPGGRVARYRLHETMREYTRAKLREAGEEASTHDLFVAHYVSACGRAIDEGLVNLLPWLEWFEAEIDNIRSALQRCLVEKDFARGTSLAGAAGWYWITRATTEGVRWLEGFLPTEAGDRAVRAQAYFIRGFLATLQSDVPAADIALARATTLAREAGRTRLAVQALCAHSIAMDFAGDGAQAEGLLAEAESEAARTDEPTAKAALLQARDNHAFATGDPAAAAPWAAESVRIARESGDIYALEYGLMHLGFAGFFLGDPPQARSALADSLRLARQIDDRLAEFYLFSAFASLAAIAGEAKLAAQLLGATESIRVSVGASTSVMLAPLLASAQDAAVSGIGPEKYEVEFIAGKKLTREAAIDLALGERTEVTIASAVDGEGALLGKREADVARLVAKGLSNKEIGARLFISERTVESHVRNILNKLGFNSRTQIASWVGST